MSPSYEQLLGVWKAASLYVSNCCGPLTLEQLKLAVWAAGNPCLDIELLRIERFRLENELLAAQLEGHKIANRKTP
jgi:hypothetical protein